MNLDHTISSNIEDVDVNITEFGNIAIYLMENGVICRSDSTIERELYDKFIRVKEELMQYFKIIGVHLYHNEEFYSVRAYAPDASYPNSDEIIDSGSSMLRMTMNKDLAASLLVSYLLYEQYRAEARLEDDFTAVIQQHEFETAHAAMLGIDAISIKNKTQKDEMYKQLKKLKAINYNKDFFSSEEYPIIIRPLIFDIILEENILEVLENNSRRDKNED